MKERINEGNDFIIERESREFGSKPVEAFRISGKTGAVTVGGVAIKTYLQLAVTGLAAPGSVVLAGAKIGDVVASVTNLTVPANAPGVFETTITVDGHIQQTIVADESAVVFLVQLERA